MLGHSAEWWLRWLEIQCGVDSVWGIVKTMLWTGTCLHLYFATCWDHVFAFRIEHHMDKLRYGSTWRSAWWHHPRRGVAWPLFGHWFLTAYLFELWYWITVRHGRTLPQCAPEEQDNYVQPVSKPRPKPPNPQLEFDFGIA